MHFCSAYVGSVVATAAETQKAPSIVSPPRHAVRPFQPPCARRGASKQRPTEPRLSLGVDFRCPRTDGLAPGGTVPEPNCKRVSSTRRDLRRTLRPSLHVREAVVPSARPIGRQLNRVECITVTGSVERRVVTFAQKNTADPVDSRMARSTYGQSSGTGWSIRPLSPAPET
jgi:hypothetical protein